MDIGKYMITTDTHIYFYGGIYSQWYPCLFEHEGTFYTSAEQWMMAGKAKLFKDDEMLGKIMATDDCWKQKMEYGRNVKNFDINKWNTHARDIVTAGNVLKFKQDPYLFNQITVESGNRKFVEGSPTDCIWGVGLAYNDPLIYDEKNWRGINWLGECLVDARKILRNMNSPII